MKSNRRLFFSRIFNRDFEEEELCPKVRAVIHECTLAFDRAGFPQPGRLDVIISILRIVFPSLYEDTLKFHFQVFVELLFPSPVTRAVGWHRRKVRGGLMNFFQSLATQAA